MRTHTKQVDNHDCGISYLSLGFVDDLSKEDIQFLNKLNVPLSNELTNIQKLLNMQYYLLLSITGNKDLYNSNFSYTEFDKTLILENLILERENLINSLNKIRKNFVYQDFIDKSNVPIYINSENLDLKNIENYPIVFLKSDDNSGFKVLEKTLILYVGNGKNNFKTLNYQFLSNILTPNNLLELKEVINSSTGVYNILSWKRNEINKHTNNVTLEEKFLKLEGI